MNEKSINKIIKSWFKKKKIKINNKNNILKDEILDSFDIIDFISFLEEKFDIKFTNDELQKPNNLVLEVICKVVKKKMNV